MEQLAGDNAPDPQEVADTIVELIETPAGHRPLRTVVDPMTGGGAGKAVNRTSEQVQVQLFESFKMSSVRSVEVPA